MQTNFPSILAVPPIPEIGHINLPHFSFETAEAIVSRDKNDLLDRGKNLPDLQYSAYRHQVHVAIMKIQGVLTCMKLAGKSPEHMRMEAEKQLKTLRESMGQFLTNNASYKDQSTEGRNQLEQSRVAVFNTKVNFSLLTPSTEDKPENETRLNRFRGIVTTSLTDLKPPEMFEDRLLLAESRNDIQITLPQLIPGSSTGNFLDLDRPIINPKKVVGVALTPLAAALAAFSMTCKTIISTFVEICFEEGINTTCFRNDPENYKQCIDQLHHIFNGGDPVLSHRLKEETPRWIEKGIKLFNEGDTLLTQFDAYMAKEFSTIPGLIHEATEGTIDLLLGATLKVGHSILKTGSQMTVRGFERVALVASQATKLPTSIKLRFPFTGGAPKTVRPDYTDNIFLRLNHIIEESAKVTPSAHSVPAPFSYYLQREIDHLIPLVPKLENQVGSLFPASKALSYTLLKQNHFDDQIYRISHAWSPIVLIGDEEKVLSSFMGLHYFRSLNLKLSQVPQPLAIAQHNGKFTLAMSNAGESFDVLMSKLSGVVHDQRRETLTDLANKFTKAGQASAELHLKSRSSYPPGHYLHNEFILRLEEFSFEDLKMAYILNRIPIDPTPMIEFTKKFLLKTPIQVGMTHGDAHIGNITWCTQSNKIGFIDFEVFTSQFTIQKQPKSFPLLDFLDMQNSIIEKGLLFNLSGKEISLLTKSYKKGYKSIYPSDNPMLEEVMTKLYLLDVKMIL